MVSWLIPTVLYVVVVVLLFVQLRRKNKFIAYQQAVIAWQDERDEKFLIPTAQAVQGAQAIQLPPLSTFAQFFKHGQLTKEGVMNAGHLLEQHEALIAANRAVAIELKDATKLYKELAEWERDHPVPTPPQ